MRHKGACLKGWEGVGRVGDIETQGACLKGWEGWDGLSVSEGKGGLGWAEFE